MPVVEHGNVSPGTNESTHATPDNPSITSVNVTGARVTFPVFVTENAYDTVSPTPINPSPVVSTTPVTDFTNTIDATGAAPTEMVNVAVVVVPFVSAT